jgi:hypothetical protein
MSFAGTVGFDAKGDILHLERRTLRYRWITSEVGAWRLPERSEELLGLAASCTDEGGAFLED